MTRRFTRAKPEKEPITVEQAKVQLQMRLLNTRSLVGVTVDTIVGQSRVPRKAIERMLMEERDRRVARGEAI